MYRMCRSPYLPGQKEQATSAEQKMYHVYRKGEISRIGGDEGSQSRYTLSCTMTLKVGSVGEDVKVSL